MNKLFKFNWDCGRMGTLDGLFVATQKEVDNAIGEHLDFGEALGKHSEIDGPFEEGDIQVICEDQVFIKKLLEILGYSVSGFNPLDYLPENEAV